VLALALRHPPLTAFFVIYLLTCYIGAMALLVGPGVVRRWYVFRTAAELPPLSNRDLAVDLILLNVAPVLLALGWWTAGRAGPRLRLHTMAPRRWIAARISPWPPVRAWATRVPGVTPRPFASLAFVTIALTAYLVVREAMAGGFDLVSGWFGYGRFVAGRAAIVKALSTWDFVAAYTMLPLLVGLLMSAVLLERPRSKVRMGVLAAVAAGFLIVNLLLFQKRALLIGLLLIAFVVVARFRGHGRFRRLRVRGRLIVSIAGGLYLLYIGLLAATLVPAQPPPPSQAVTALAIQASQTTFPGLAVTSSTAVTFPSYADAVSHRRTYNSLPLLFLLAPVTRTPGPAVAYPALYPGRHAYYSVDLGLWVAGIGNAPNDNQTSFRLLFPNVSSGTNSVPFMFVLYSQGGLLVALAGAFIVGVAWRLAWISLSRIVTTGAGACGAALLVLFGINIAQDSVMNSLLVSYGIVWPALVVAAGALAGAVRFKRATVPGENGRVPRTSTAAARRLRSALTQWLH
jgi:hypothetical protein